MDSHNLKSDGGFPCTKADFLHRETIHIQHLGQGLTVFFLI